MAEQLPDINGEGVQPTAIPPSAASPAPQQTIPPQPMQRMGCTGDCKRCNASQRDFCAAQIAFNSQFAVARLESAVSALSQTLDAIEAQNKNLLVMLTAMKEKAEQHEADFFTPEVPAKPKPKTRTKARAENGEE